MHDNNTIELFCVLEGTINTVVGVGALDLKPGDCVAMPGVDHATHAGPGRRARGVDQHRAGARELSSRR